MAKLTATARPTQVPQQKSRALGPWRIAVAVSTRSGHRSVLNKYVHSLGQICCARVGFVAGCLLIRWCVRAYLLFVCVFDDDDDDCDYDGGDDTDADADDYDDDVNDDGAAPHTIATISEPVAVASRAARVSTLLASFNYLV